MSARVTRAYPFLIAFVPILYYAANNPDLYAMRDLFTLLAITAGACLLVYLLAALVSKGRTAPALPAFVTFLFVLWLYGYRRVARLVADHPENAPHLVLVAVGLAVSVALIRLVRRREDLLDGLGRFLTVMSALIVGWSALRIGREWLRGETLVAESALARELAKPIEGPPTVPAPQRDIYLIVVDEYANTGVLRERFGYDNTPFEDSLRALGFHVPRVVRSNYLHTLLSLPSLLNAAHLTGLTGEVGERATHPRLPNHLLEHNRVVRYLRERGYEYVFFPSDWWHSTSASPEADVVFDAFPGFNLMQVLSGGELERTIKGQTPLVFLGRHYWEARHVERSLEGLADLAGRGTRPRFVFAHVIKPHEPYVFTPTCEVVEWRYGVEEADRYLEQLECLNRLLLRTVRRILAESPLPPVIILQGDHGTKLLHATGYDSPDSVPPAAARERFGAFGAYYLPAGGEAAFGDTVTVVNVMGNVLRHYFGAHLPRAPDEQYISPASAPYDFRRVDASWLAGDGSAGAGARAGG